MDKKSEYYEVLRTRIRSTIMRKGPIDADGIRRFLRLDDTPMPTIQEVIVDLHIGGIIEKRQAPGRGKKVRWIMATKQRG